MLVTDCSCHRPLAFSNDIIVFACYNHSSVGQPPRIHGRVDEIVR